MDDLNQYKTPEKREWLLKHFKQPDETEEEFFKCLPEGAWLIDSMDCTQEDIELSKESLKVLGLLYEVKDFNKVLNE